MHFFSLSQRKRAISPYEKTFFPSGKHLFGLLKRYFPLRKSVFTEGKWSVFTKIPPSGLSENHPVSE